MHVCDWGERGVGQCGKGSSASSLVLYRQVRRHQSGGGVVCVHVRD